MFFRLAFLLVILGLTPRVCGGDSLGVSANWTSVEKRLKRNHFHRGFIAALKGVYSDKGFSDVVRLNTLLYLKKTDYHGPQVTGDAQDEVREFLDEHKVVFNSVEKKHKVDRFVIAGLLWMESRFGQNKGRYHVPSVFCHLLQGDRDDVRQRLYSAAEEYGPVSNQIKREIRTRTIKKAKWAVRELRAISKLYAKNNLILEEWMGSFSGAFGYPQFLPTSYLAYARPFSKNKFANLYEAPDSINSVAVYLKSYGWKSNKAKTHQTALFKYNNSSDYAKAILDLSKRVRSPASK